MATMNISLPDELRNLLNRQVAAQRYSSSNEGVPPVPPKPWSLPGIRRSLSLVRAQA